MPDERTTSNPAAGSTTQAEAQMGRLAQAIHEFCEVGGTDHVDSTVTDVDRAAISHTRVGHYQLTREIDAGGMGFVYEAIQDQPRRAVAVKLMRHGLSSKAALRRFQFEAQILARLRHQGIAQIFEAGTHQHGELAIPFFAMELIPGAKTITNYAAAKKLSLRQRLELFIEVCDAVHHAHQKGILHRDLKPANILIDMNGRPKVIDFGIARAVDADQVPATLQTTPDQLLGTLQYMSPEQLEGDPREIDARVDVYALGVVLFELLCSRLPYAVTPTRPDEASRIIRECPPTLPHSINGEVSGDLETVLLTALHKDRIRRYQSAQELADELRRALNEDPIFARRDSATYILRTKMRAAVGRHRWVTAAVVAAIGLIVAEILGTLIGQVGGEELAFARFVPALVPTHDLASLQHVRVIALRHDADSLKLPDGRTFGAASTTQPWVGRRLHAQLLNRLVNSGATVIGLDYRFAAESPADLELKNAIRDAKAAGIEVTLPVAPWPKDLTTSPTTISPVVLPEITWGGGTMLLEAPDPWGANLVVRRGVDDPIPSFALVTAAAAWHRLEHRSYVLQEYPVAAVFVRAGSAPSEQIPVSPCMARDEGHARPDFAIFEGDVVGEYLIAMPSDAALKASTVSYHDVLSASPAQLSEWFAGRVIIIGDDRPERDDGHHKYPDGRQFSGMMAQAVAVDSLLAHRQIQDTGVVGAFGIWIWSRYLLDVLGAIAGTGIALIALGPLRRICYVAAFCLTAFASVILLYRVQSVLVDPLVTILAAIICCEILASAERARRRRLA